MKTPQEINQLLIELTNEFDLLHSKYYSVKRRHDKIIVALSRASTLLHSPEVQKLLEKDQVVFDTAMWLLNHVIDEILNT